MNRRDFLKLAAASGAGLALGLRPDVEVEEVADLEELDRPLAPFPPIQVYYVDSTYGDDRNDGLDVTTAWKTLKRAEATVQAGDVVCWREAITDQTGVRHSPILESIDGANNWRSLS
jgi:hypothetical protein